MEKFTCMPIISIATKKKKPKLLFGRRVKIFNCMRSSSPTAGNGSKITSRNGCTDNSLKENNLCVLKSLPSSKKESSIIPMVIKDGILTRTDSSAVDGYAGLAENSKNQSMKIDYHTDSDLQPKRELDIDSNGLKTDSNINELSKAEAGKGNYFLESPLLRRSYSNFETKQAEQWIMSPERSSFYSNSCNLQESVRVKHSCETSGALDLSMRSNCSADCVMLKRETSSRALPSCSRKLNLSSCRNLQKLSSPQKHVSVLSAPNQIFPKLDDERKMPPVYENRCAKISLEHSFRMDIINPWINSLDVEECCEIDEQCDRIDGGEQTDDRCGSESLESSKIACSETSHSVPVEMEQTANVFQSLNRFSLAAHFTGIGLKDIPSMSAFICLRSVNLSGNCIVNITPGSLPKSLHTLDLSWNKISTIEGLQHLEKLRVLILSHNRITKIGNGLSNCTLIKELYLAGNKISYVEGLHRILKLRVLDLSFNKIITAKGLGQLVANYNSLLALNLSGNPIQSNIGDDRLTKEVISLLPHVAFLNKQPIKPDRVREAVTENVAKAALGDATQRSKRKITRRFSQGLDSSTKSKVVGGSLRSKSFDSVKYSKNSSQLLVGSKHKAQSCSNNESG